MQDFTEDKLVEQPTIALFQKLGYSFIYAFDEKLGTNGTLGRESSDQVILLRYLQPALAKLNPELPPDALDAAIEELLKDRSALSLAEANKEVYKLLRDGIQVSYQNNDGHEAVDKVFLIDWNKPENNHFLLVSQFWVTGSIYKRRADLVVFVNGLPLVFIELKRAHSKLESAFNGNLRDYKTTIPQLFWYNAFIVLSNGAEAKIGSITAEWKRFSDWKKVDSEEEKGIISLETVIRGTCSKPRLLDIVENFILYDNKEGATTKIVAQNHQYLGVNNAVRALLSIKQNHGRLGVFWHTQGSGKSYSMVFFSQKVLRKVPGNWSFVVISDRDDLGGQIYRDFARTGAVIESEEMTRAQSGEHLKQMLREDHRYVFTLIQKFGINQAAAKKQGVLKLDAQYPKLTDRDDVIVMTDEAHRSQYDSLARNMRNALPQAAFIGFTGTPLMAGEEKTKEVFGEYVSVYNFRQSIEDGATVPLYYENRVPELQITDPNLQDKLADVVDGADLDEEQLKKLDREFAREYHLITRDDRLEKIAEDLVSHFMNRGYMGKAMVVSIDKLTAVKMYDKVQKYWKAYLGGLQGQLAACDGPKREEIEAKIKFMEKTDMAVVISQEQNEVELFKQKGLDITRHRERLVKEDLEGKFKAPDDEFRIVFVCAMWIVGFDAPGVTTLYLDKPMKNHSLMQTMARANRVFREKTNGLIVDYVGVFRDVRKALAIYATGGTGDGDIPIKPKAELVKDLEKAIEEAKKFCQERGVDLNSIINAQGFAKIAELENASAALVDKQTKEAIEEAEEKIIVNDELKKKFSLLSRQVDSLYKAICPDPQANKFTAIRACLTVLMENVRKWLPETSIEHVTKEIADVLDEGIATTGYVIHATEEASIIDLSEIDFEKLREWFDKSKKRKAIEKLKLSIEEKLKQMLNVNNTRASLMEKFKALIEEYNSGMDVETTFAKLMDFVKELNEEDQRGVMEELTEEELAIFDILTRPEMSLSKKELAEVKKVARKLLVSLKQAKLVLDWRKRQKTKADVYGTIKDILDELPRAYAPEIYEQKCDRVFEHVFEKYGDVTVNN